MERGPHPVTVALSAVWRIKLAAIRAALVWSGLAMAALVFLQVIIRYFTTGSVYGIEEVALSFAVWFYFLGAARGAYTRSHVSASLLEILTPAGRARDSLALVTAVLTAVLSVWVTLWAVQYVHWVYERDMVSLDLGFPMVYVHASVAIGMGLMSLYFLTQVIEQAALLYRGRGRAITPNEAQARADEGRGEREGDGAPSQTKARR